MVTQPLTAAFKADSKFSGYTSYIMSSYIEYLESAGARTVPLLYNGNKTTELAKLNYLNGVFYCGGKATAASYDNFGKTLFKKVKTLNDAGQYLPVWGTCLGFENMAEFVSDDKSTVLSSDYDSDDENYVLEFLEDPSSTRMFSPLGDDA